METLLQRKWRLQRLQRRVRSLWITYQSAQQNFIHTWSVWGITKMFLHTVERKRKIIWVAEWTSMNFHKISSDFHRGLMAKEDFDKLGLTDEEDKFFLEKVKERKSWSWNYLSIKHNFHSLVLSSVYKLQIHHSVFKFSSCPQVSTLLIIQFLSFVLISLPHGENLSFSNYMASFVRMPRWNNQDCFVTSFDFIWYSSILRFNSIDYGIIIVSSIRS